MAGIMVPKARAETPVGGGNNDAPFPEGDWIGSIEKVEVTSLPFTPKAGQGYATPEDVEQTTIWLADNKSTNGGPDVGKRKFFARFITRDGEVSVEDAPNISETSWQLQRSAALLANAAAALGATEEVEMDGETYVKTTDGFLGQLQAGDLDGTRVGFGIYHGKEYTVKRGTPDEAKRRDANIREFFQAV